MRELVSTFVVGTIGVLSMFALIWWVLYFPGVQIRVWAWVVDIWHPSTFPIVVSIWYWILPVVSTIGWFLCSMHQAFAGLPQPKRWFGLNVLLWAPIWIYPMGVCLLALFTFVGIAGMFVPHQKN